MLFEKAIKTINDNIIDPVGDRLGTSGFAQEAQEWKDNGYALIRSVYNENQADFNYRTALKHTHKGNYKIAATRDEKIAADHDADLTNNTRQELKNRGAMLGLKRV